MAAVKGKDTKPEMIVQKYLFSRGLRYRVNNRNLMESPDFVKTLTSMLTC
ncbi:MAG: very short patch repair endonuclease [Ruminococcus sp.]|nr:very short patch repair endonuclease [Ruminococcus sp.]